MRTSKQWIGHFTVNLTKQRINWDLGPDITEKEISTILSSMQAWQLGETSDGAHLVYASTQYANKINDPDYVEAVKLFIKEEQKHGENLGKYLDAINRPRIRQNWGDTLFRRVRYFNTNMETWTLAVITVESAAQVYYQALKDATGCSLLRQICTDILIDEAYHIDFQSERMQLIVENKNRYVKWFSRYFYPFFFFSTSLVVWMGHRKLFEAGGVSFRKYMYKMKCKYYKTLYKALHPRTQFSGHGLSIQSERLYVRRLINKL